MPGKQAENNFRPASNPAINHQGKQGERDAQVVRTLKGTQAERTRERKWIGRKERKEGNGYAENLLPHSIKYPQQAGYQVIAG